MRLANYLSEYFLGPVSPQNPDLIGEKRAYTVRDIRVTKIAIIQCVRRALPPLEIDCLL